tara:strand:+ start:13886 stop:14812 length:927 start_codon:yes stop_codon:yes gene_type:complete
MMTKKDKEKSNFFSNYFVLSSEKHKLLSDLNNLDIINLFEKNGCVIFKNFNIKDGDLIKFTNIYSHSYAADAIRRVTKLGNKHIKSVDMGNEKIQIHSEASFTEAWPEIIWFFCKVPPNKKGETTFCDGLELWDSLDKDTKSFFCFNPIVYELSIPVIKKPKGGRGRQHWPIHSVGIGDSYIDWDQGTLFIKQVRYAVHESRIPRKLCFANHLFVDLKNEPQIINRSLLNGKPIPKNIMKEITTKANILTEKYKWEENDLVMLDNKRFLHGRESFDQEDLREIVQVQTSRASFPYDSIGRESKINKEI